MPDEKLKLKKFKALSAGLTGLSMMQLSPNVDPIGLAQQYWDTLQESLDERLRADVDAMLEEVKPNSKDDANKPAEPADENTIGKILANDRFAPLARSILKLWILGAFYHPRTPQTPTKIVSSQAYKESLVWKTMQGHPMGYSMLPYGHWSEEPLPLNAFLALVPSTEAKHG